MKKFWRIKNRDYAQIVRKLWTPNGEVIVPVKNHFWLWLFHIDTKMIPIISCISSPKLVRYIFHQTSQFNRVIRRAIVIITHSRLINEWMESDIFKRRSDIEKPKCKPRFPERILLVGSEKYENHVRLWKQHAVYIDLRMSCAIQCSVSNFPTFPSD